MQQTYFPSGFLKVKIMSPPTTILHTDLHNHALFHTAYFQTCLTNSSTSPNNTSGSSSAAKWPPCFKSAQLPSSRFPPHFSNHRPASNSGSSASTYLLVLTTKDQIPRRRDPALGSRGDFLWEAREAHWFGEVLRPEKRAFRAESLDLGRCC